MKYKDPVYAAIDTLSAIKHQVSYAEIASVAGVKKQVAINYIIRNKHLLNINKNGKIAGFITYENNVRRIVNGMFSMGKVYTTAQINYGADQQILVDTYYYDKVKHLASSYYVGGIGDCFEAVYIVHTTENVKAMNQLGFRDFNEVVNEKKANGEDRIVNDWTAP